MKQEQKLSSFFMQKKLAGSGGEAGELSLISQPLELQEPIGDNNLDDIRCSKFQYLNILTQTIKMPCGTYDPPPPPLINL